MSGRVAEQILVGDNGRSGHILPPGEDGEFVEPTGPVVSKSSKKKKSRKGACGRRGPCALPRNRGTGFEEYFADPPLTPDEAAEERLEVYAPCIPFEERIQSCIQRFRSRRRLQGDQPLFFNEYLFLGGVDTSQNSFGGLDNKDLRDLGPAERRDATARDTVHIGSAANEKFYSGDREHWSVDFSGIAAGFLSISLGHLSGFEKGKFETGIAVVEHFLRYVLQHDVCPEYQENVESALLVCQKARGEWPMLNQLMSDLPGHFNLAAAEVFSTVDPGDWSFLSFKRPEDFDAKTEFLAVCALCGEMETLDCFACGRLAVVKEYTRTMRITDIQRPSVSLIDAFASISIEGIDRAIEPVGRLCLQGAVIEDEWERPEMLAPKDGDQLWIYLEDRLLINMIPGMKMEAKFVELSTGIRFLKSMLRIVPTFYTFLPQQMMKHHKAVRDNDRPAPSIHDPAAEEAHMSCEHE